MIARADMVKGYEFEKDRFMLFSPEELKALEEASSPTIEIMAFISEKSIDRKRSIDHALAESSAA